MAKPEKLYVVLRMPQDSWDTLSETLEMDSESGSFDRDLRKDIRKALDSVEVLEVLDEGVLKEDRKKEEARKKQ